jgi:hypothetical protein
MADAPVFDIKIHPRDRDLLIGTHGRSIYAANIAVLQDMTEEVLSTSAHLFTPLPVVSFNRLEHRDFIAQGTYVGANPPYGAPLNYYLREPGSNIKITIEDRDGGIVHELEGTGTAGVNLVHWDLRYTPPPQAPRQQQAQPGIDPTPARPAESSFARVPGDTGGGGDPTGGESSGIQATPAGPMAFPGEYVVRLSANGTEKRTLLTIKPDPRTTISDDHRRMQSEIVLGVYRLQTEANPTSFAANALNTQMTAITRALGEMKDLSEELKKAGEDTAKRIRDVQTQISRHLGQLGGVARDVANSTSAPTELQVGTYRTASEALRKAIPEFRALEEIVREFNNRLDQASVPATVPRLKL